MLNLALAAVALLSLVVVALVGLLAFKERTHREAVLSERVAGEQRLKDLRSLLDDANEMARNDWQRMATCYEQQLDRLQARSVMEFQAARQVAAMVPQAEAPAEEYDRDWESPSFARPMENGAVEVMD